ncbi:hypothetical protein BA953_01440 [Vibrio coralliilyticus]|nr:hypothetical protein BA953_01440 [Vibrio coralliilyticus]
MVFTPLILLFIPDYAPQVAQGFEALQNIPEPRRRRHRYAWHARDGSLFVGVFLRQIQGGVMGLLEAMLISLITGVVSSAGTIAALKTDINWIKKVQQDQEQRIRKLEDSHG